MSSATGTNLRQMDLDDLIQNSERICRVTVLSITEGSVEIGGGTLPTLTYNLEILNAFKGRKQEVASVTMVATPSEASSASGLKRFPLFRDVPQLEAGGDYVLFLTQPSPAGLSTTVGLGQGCFKVLLLEDREFAVNSFNNAGLGLKASVGPVPYEELADAIQGQDPK